MGAWQMEPEKGLDGPGSEREMQGRALFRRDRQSCHHRLMRRSLRGVGRGRW